MAHRNIYRGITVNLHPQAQFPACSTSSYPVQCRVEFGNGRYCGNALAAQLRQLLPLRCVYVNKAVHISYAEALNIVLWELLPLCS